MIVPQYSNDEFQRLIDLAQVSQNPDIRFLADMLRRILIAIENHYDYCREQEEPE